MRTIHLNRIGSATETASSTQAWKQEFNYDRYGNRNITSGTGQTNLTFNTANNRITTSGYSYDSVGNTTNDPSGKTFTYDAENKQKEVKNSSNAILGTYYFDGDGKRVKKISSTETTIFVYDGGGQLAAEYSTTVVQQTDAKVAYLTTDHLGSPRVITDQNGTVISRKDFAAFGDQISTPQRTGGTNGNGYDPPKIIRDIKKTQNRISNTHRRDTTTHRTADLRLSIR